MNKIDNIEDICEIREDLDSLVSGDLRENSEAIDEKIRIMRDLVLTDEYMSEDCKTDICAYIEELQEAVDNGDLAAIDIAMDGLLTATDAAVDAEDEDDVDEDESDEEI